MLRYTSVAVRGAGSAALRNKPATPRHETLGAAVGADVARWALAKISDAERHAVDGAGVARRSDLKISAAECHAGAKEGTTVGVAVGRIVGAAVGQADGSNEGVTVGKFVGDRVAGSGRNCC